MSRDRWSVAKEQTAVFRIEALDGASKVLKKVDASLSRMGKATADVGKSMTLGITAPLAAFGVNAIRVGAEFEQSMNMVQAATGASAEEMGKLNDLAKKLGAATTFSAGQASEAMLALSKAGFGPAEIQAGALAETMKLAATEGMDLAESAEIIAQQMGAFGLAASDTARISDALAGASTASTASVQGLAQGLAQVGTIANAAGLSIEETAGALALMADKGIQGSDAGTSLKTLLARLQPTTKEASAAMEKLGLNFIAANGEFVSIAEVAGQLQSKMSGLSEAQRAASLQTIFGSDAVRAANILYQGGASAIEKYTAAASDKAAAENLSEAATKGVGGALEQMKGALETLSLEVFEQMAPYVVQAANALQGLFAKFSQLSPEMKKVIVIGGAIAAALGPVLVVVGTVVSAIGSIAGAIGAVSGVVAGVSFAPIIAGALAIGAAVAVVIKYWDEIKAATSAMVGYVVGMFNSWRERNADTINGIIASLQSIWQSYQTIFSAVAGIVMEKVNAVIGYLNNLLAPIGGLQGAWEIYKEVVLQVLGAITTTVGTVFNGIATWLKFVASVLTDNRSIWQQFTDFLKAKLTEATLAVGNMVLAMIEKIKALPAAFLQAGRDAIQGLVNGVKEKASAAIDAVAGVADGVMEKFKGALGIKSPSRVFMEFGRFITEGLGIGIQSGVTNVNAGMNAMNDALEPSLLQTGFDSVMQNMSSGIDQFVETGKVKFGDLAASILKDLAKIAMNNVFQGIVGSVFGGFGGGVGAPSFAGGGYTGSGSRTGGIDGQGGFPAILHPNETVVDHARGQGMSGGNSISVSQTIYVKEEMSESKMRQVAEGAKALTLQAMQSISQRGGGRKASYGLG